MTVGLFTGTFDPPHKGHTEAIEEALASNNQIEHIYLIAHDWSKSKQPLPLQQRISWLKYTVTYFIPHLQSSITIIENRMISEDPSNLDTMVRTMNKVTFYRITGNDEMQTHQAHYMQDIIISIQRPPLQSSTLIREAAKSNNLQSVAHLLAPEVLAEIIDKRLYVN